MSSAAIGGNSAAANLAAAVKTDSMQNNTSNASSAYLPDQARENMELRIESHIKEQQSNFFALIVSGLIAFFSILITSIVIFFAIKTREAAVAEAKLGVEDFRKTADNIVRTIRTEFELAKNDIEGMRIAANADSRVISDVRMEAQAWAANAAQTVAAQQALSLADQLTLDIRSQVAQGKTADRFSPEDFFLLIAKHLEQENWELARELAASMKMMTSNATIQSAGYFYEGTALYRLGRVEEAIAVFEQAIERFGSIDVVEVKHQIIKIWNNMIVALMKVGQNDKVLALIPDCILRLAVLPEKSATDLRRKLMINKGNALSRLGRHTDAITTYDEVIAELRRDDPVDRDRLAHAVYNKACAHALMGQVTKTVSLLEESRGFAVTAATKDLVSDTDFDPIRNKPTFQRFLKKHGLAVTA